MQAEAGEADVGGRRLHLAEGEQVRAVADQFGAAVDDLEHPHRFLVQEAAMEELGGEAQPLTVPQRVTRIEADRAVGLVVQVLQRVGQGGVGRLIRVLCQIARQVAHGRRVERRRLLGARATAQRSNDRYRRGLQQNLTPTHCVSPGSSMRTVSHPDWGEIMQLKPS